MCGTKTDKDKIQEAIDELINASPHFAEQPSSFAESHIERALDILKDVVK